jgi:hypothetical protein
VDFFTENGLRVKGTPTVQFGWENLEAIALKCLRGAFFDRANMSLGRDMPCWARAYSEVDPRPEIERWLRIPTCSDRRGIPILVRTGDG